MCVRVRVCVCVCVFVPTNYVRAHGHAGTDLAEVCRLIVVHPHWSNRHKSAKSRGSRRHDKRQRKGAYQTSQGHHQLQASIVRACVSVSECVCFSLHQMTFEQASLQLQPVAGFIPDMDGDRITGFVTLSVSSKTCKTPPNYRKAKFKRQ